MMSTYLVFLDLCEAFDELALEGVTLELWLCPDVFWDDEVSVVEVRNCKKNN